MTCFCILTVLGSKTCLFLYFEKLLSLIDSFWTLVWMQEYQYSDH